MQETDVGWLVRRELRPRWRLSLGSTRENLPALLEELGQVDVFIHDSEHSYENMTFEYEAAWPHIKVGGYLLSDDVKWNSAFRDFTKKVDADAKALDFGVARKSSWVPQESSVGSVWA